MKILDFRFLGKELLDEVKKKCRNYITNVMKLRGFACRVVQTSNFSPQVDDFGERQFSF